jgi:hypothetical protein
MPIMGFLLDTNDFMILNKDGINIIAIGDVEARDVLDNEGFVRKIHSLGSMEYLKVEKTNHLLFACQNYNNRQVCVQEQYNDSEGNTKFDDIYRVKVHEITLRELLVV